MYLSNIQVFAFIEAPSGAQEDGFESNICLSFVPSSFPTLATSHSIGTPVQPGGVVK